MPEPARSAAVPSAAYDDDFLLWTAAQADLLRRRRFDAVDLEHLVAELVGLGVAQKSELLERLTGVAEHLLRLEHGGEPHLRPAWIETVDNQRQAIAYLLDASPSLQPLVEELGQRGFRVARVRAGRALRERERAALSGRAPYPAAVLLDDDFIPGGRDVRS